MDEGRQRKPGFIGKPLNQPFIQYANNNRSYANGTMLATRRLTCSNGNVSCVTIVRYN